MVRHWLRPRNAAIGVAMLLVMGLIASLAALRVWSPPSSSLFRFPHPVTAADSITEIQQRLAPYADRSQTAAIFPPDPCQYSRGYQAMPSPADSPTYRARIQLGSARAEALLWITPGVSVAREAAGWFQRRMQDCPSTIDESGSATGQIRATVEYEAEPAPGWQGTRAVLAGQSGNDTDEVLRPVTEITTVAQRGVIVAAMQWRRDGAATGQDPPDRWRRDGQRELNGLLALIGGDAARLPPGAPARDVATRLVVALPPPSTYHPLAATSDRPAPDLLCQLRDSTERQAEPLGVAQFTRGLRAEVGTATERQTGQAEPAESGPYDASAVTERIAVYPDRAQARRSVQAMATDPDWRPVAKPCQTFAVAGPDGSWSGMDAPRASEEVVASALSEEPLEVGRWTGQWQTVGSRYADVRPDAPTHESAAQVVAVVRWEQVVVYLRWQRGAGTDLIGSIAEGKALLTTVLAQLDAEL